MVNMKSVKVNLPTATTATPDTKRDFVDISVDKAGAVFLDKKPVGSNELVMSARRVAKDESRICASSSAAIRTRATATSFTCSIWCVRPASTRSRSKSANPKRRPSHEPIPAIFQSLRRSRAGGIVLRPMAVKSPAESARSSIWKRFGSDQAAKIAEQDKTIKGYLADLDDLRQRLTLSESALKDARINSRHWPPNATNWSSNAISSRQVWTNGSPPSPRAMLH